MFEEWKVLRGIYEKHLKEPIVSGQNALQIKPDFALEPDSKSWLSRHSTPYLGRDLLWQKSLINDLAR